MEKFNVTGMSCAACSAHVEKAVAAVPGVTDVAVSLLTNQMRVEYMAPATAENICAAVTAAGYGAAPAEQGQRREAATVAALEDHATPGLVRRLIASICVLLPLMYVSMGHMLWNWPLPGFLAGNHVSVGLFELLLTGVIMVVNQRFFVSGVQGLLHRAPNMDTLVALGAFLGSRPQIQSLPMPWLGRFQTAALLLLIVTLGAELGANEEIISSLGTIGLNALAVTLTSMVGSMLAVHALRKYLLKLNAQGRSCQEAPGRRSTWTTA